MSGLKYKAIDLAFKTFTASGATGIVRQFSNCLGVIFTLHRVVPEAPADFSPNALLQVTPEFLEAVILRARELDIDLISLDEAIGRIESGKSERPFAVLTLDDGYRDNLVYALPIFKKYNCPFTMYIPTGLIDGRGGIWWQALEDMISGVDEIADAQGNLLSCKNTEEKNAAFHTIYWQMREMPEAKRVKLIHEMADAHGLDLFAHCRDLIMDWSELQTFVDEPLCTIGAHSVSHHELSKLSQKRVREEMKQSADVLEAKTGTRPQHFSYPIGAVCAAHTREYEMAQKTGFKSAVTTLPGGLYARDASRLHALPRVSLNGFYQNKSYIDVFLTGALFSTVGKWMG